MGNSNSSEKDSNKKEESKKDEQNEENKKNSDNSINKRSFNDFNASLIEDICKSQENNKNKNDMQKTNTYTNNKEYHEEDNQNIKNLDNHNNNNNNNIINNSEVENVLGGKANVDVSKNINKKPKEMKNDILPKKKNDNKMKRKNTNFKLHHFLNNKNKKQHIHGINKNSNNNNNSNNNKNISNNKNTQKNDININKNINNNKIQIINELEGEEEERDKIIFTNTLKIPDDVLNPNLFIFENINIFNSLLIMMNNISLLNNYFSKDNTKNKIYNCDNNNQYCLGSILYYINQYMWNNKDKSKISIDSLSKKYSDFIDCYTKTNCNQSNLEKYCHDIHNLELIVNFIYKKINDELTSQSHNKNNNNNNNNIISNRNDTLSMFLNEFMKYHKSFISDNFIGFYQNKKICVNCENKKQRYSLTINNNCEYNYSFFSCINFNLDEIKNYFTNINKNYMDNSNNIYYCNFNSLQIHNDINLDLNNCFYYTFFKNNKKYESYCNYCFLNTQQCEFSLIYSLPNILTIILSNYEDCNFIIKDELDLKDYTINCVKEPIYYLISILCQISYSEKFIIYCINPNNGLWYSYTDNKIEIVQQMDINAIPLVFIYQSKHTINYNYNTIQRDNNTMKLTVKFNNGISSINVIFNKYKTIKDVIQQISSIKNLGGTPIKLLIGGKMVHEDETLLNITENGSVVLVMID